MAVDGSSLAMDLMGIDPEGICKVDDGFWVSDEYGPSLLKFNSQGRLLYRFVPKGYYSKSEIKKLNKQLGRGVIKENLPAILLQRQQNRGFETLACGPKKLYVSLQSPIKAGTLQIPILEFDLSRKKVSRVLIHILDSVKADKLGDFTLHNGKLLVIEQNSKVDNQAIKKVYALDLTGNIVTKTLVLDLVQAGHGDIEKFEGLASVDDKTLAVINDNDFGLLNPFIINTPAQRAPEKKSFFFMFPLEN
jgi:3-phytase